MEFGWPPDLEAFRVEIKAFIEEWRTPELLEEVAAQGHGNQRTGPRPSRGTSANREPSSGNHRAR